MLDTIDKSTKAYDQLYKNRVVLVKVSGEELVGEKVQQLISDIQWLISRDIRVVLVFGGGTQITQKYKAATGKERPKVDGVGVTDDEVLMKGVMPAYNDIRDQLQGLLPDGVFMEPNDMPCTLHPAANFGLVGIPEKIELPKDSPLTVLGFMGTVTDSSRHSQALLQKIESALVNVNADDIAVALVRQDAAVINELIFVTNTGGVLKKPEAGGGVAPLLTDIRLQKILDGEDKEVEASGGMYKKIEAILSVLKQVGKIAMTDAKGLRAEIEQWKGKGTFCADTAQLSFDQMDPMEEAIFDTVYEEFERLEIFRHREKKELDILKAHHVMLRIKNSPLGGVSLVPQEGGWIEISALWAGTIGNGFGQILLNKTKERVRHGNIYALANHPDAIAAFMANEGFECVGSVSEAIARCPERLPSSVLTYDLSRGRDPQVFLAAS